MSIYENNELEVNQNSIIEEAVNPIDVDYKKRRFIDANSISKNVNKLIDYLNPLIINIDSIKEVIRPNAKYVVQIPKEILEKMDSGEYDFMKSKGEIIANIIDKTRPKNPVVRQLRIKKELFTNPQAKASIGQMTQNISMQQQLACITEKLEDIVDKADKILCGQMTDRLGFIYGAWDTYQQALCVNDESLRNALKFEVIQSLNIGRQQLLQYIDSQEKFFNELPTSEIGATLRNINGKLIKDCSEVLNSCNQALAGIGLSTILLENIYLSYNELDVLDILMKPLRDAIDNKRDKILLVAEIAGQQEKVFEWVVNPNESQTFLEEIGESLEHNKGEFIEIELTGSDVINLSEVKNNA